MDCVVHGVPKSQTEQLSLQFTFRTPSNKDFPTSSNENHQVEFIGPFLFFLFLQGKFILFFLSTKRILRMSMVVTVKHFHFKMGNDILFLRAIHRNNYNALILSRTISVQTQESPGERVCIWCPILWIGCCFFLQYWPILTHSVFFPQWIPRARGVGCSNEPGLIPPQQRDDDAVAATRRRGTCCNKGHNLQLYLNAPTLSQVVYKSHFIHVTILRWNQLSSFCRRGNRGVG